MISKNGEPQKSSNTWPSPNPRDEYPQTAEEAEKLSKAAIRPTRKNVPIAVIKLDTKTTVKPK